MQRTKRFLQGSGITTNNPNHKDLLNSTMKNSTGDQQMCDSDQLVEKKKKKPAGVRNGKGGLHII